jgi:proliferating cell nuclear antigen
VFKDILPKKYLNATKMPAPLAITTTASDKHQFAPDTDQFEGNLHNYEFVVSTVQSSAFRTLIEALKEILTDVNIEFDSTGMKILAMDNHLVALVHMRLYSKYFERFYCPKARVCGVSMAHLFKLLKIMSQNDVLTFYIEKSNPNILNIQIETSERSLRHTFEMKLMDIATDRVDVEDTDFASVIRLVSSEFQKLCRDMQLLSEYIEIKSCSNQLIFTVKNDWVTQETVVSENKTNNGMQYIQNLRPDEVIQGIFSLKYLSLFTKCSSMCKTMEMYLKNDYPIILQYHVANLGSIKFCLASKSKDETFN